jgi:integrase
MPIVALTDRFAAAAKSPAAPQTDYFDAGTRGLALRVAAGGRKTWTVHFTSPKDGKRARLVLGTYPATSLAAARAKALEAASHVDAGRDPRDVFAAQDAAAVTVATLIGSYLEKHVTPNLRSAPAIERRLNKNVVPIIGSTRLVDLHRRDVNKVVDPIIARERPVEAARVFEDLRAALRWAVGRGDLDHNPMEGMPKPAASAPRERVLSDGEIRTLWTGLPKALKRSKQVQRIIRLCLVTAQRVGEVAGMRVDELDLDAKTWSLPGSRTKNGSPHQVPLSDMAIAIIEEAIAEAGEEPIFVFPSAAGPLPPHAVARTIGRAQERAEGKPIGRFGIVHWTAHDLRRTALTGMAKLGVAPIVAGAVANHLSVTKATVTLAVYTQYTYDREKREALTKWAERLEAIIVGRGAKVLPMKKARA